MGFLTDFTNNNYANFSKSKTQEVGIPRTVSSTLVDATQTINRVTREDLERLYITDAQTYKMVNSYKQLLLQAGYRIVAENKTNQKQYDQFFEELGKVGLHYKLPQLMERIIHDCVLYGHAYVERVYDTSGRYIVDLKPVDSKRMDYVRDLRYIIMTDLQQNPLGYVMNVGYWSDAIGDQYPNGARVIPSFIFLRNERIAHFILSPFGNGFEAVGLVEPAYNQITRKQKIEESASNAVYNATDSLIYAIVGDATRNPSVQLMNSTLTTLKNWTTNRRAVFAYPTTVASMPVEQSPQVQELLKHLRTEGAMAAGMSLSMAVGTGETNNKSTMNTERKDFDSKLNAIWFSLATQFTQKILDVIYEVNGYGSKAVMKANSVSTEDRTEFIGLLKTLSDIGKDTGVPVVTPREIRNYAKNVLNLETDEEDYAEYKRFTEYLREMPNQSKDSPINDSETEKAQVNNKQLDKNPKTKNPIQTKKNIQSSKDGYENTRE